MRPFEFLQGELRRPVRQTNAVSFGASARSKSKGREFKRMQASPHHYSAIGANYIYGFPSSLLFLQIQKCAWFQVKSSFILILINI